MNVYFCLRSDHRIYSNVLDSLKRQTMPCVIVEMRTAGGTENTHRTYSPARQKSEPECRRLIFTAMCELSDKYAVVMDWDNVQLFDTNFAEACAVMDADETIGAVSLHRTNPTHVNIGCAVYRIDMVRKSELRNIQWKRDCLCKITMEIIAKTGYKFINLDNKNRIWEM